MLAPITAIPTTGPTKGRVRVWDTLVRLFHWTVAGGVIANLTFLRHSESPHVYLGYIVTAALVVRRAARRGRSIEGTAAGGIGLSLPAAHAVRGGVPECPPQ